MQKFTFVDDENVDIAAYKWSEVKGEVKGIVQISHGMTERALRYNYFAEKLNENGFIVYAHDHRGHGYTAKRKEDLGYIADRDGFKWKIKDMKKLTEIIKEKHPNLPIILFGHSMGSFLSQRYAQIYGDDIDGLILSGSNGKPYKYTKLGILISKIEIMIIGRRAKSKIMDKLYFWNFNSAFKPNKTKYDWLSSSQDEVYNFINDELCGFICSTSFYYDLLKGLHKIHMANNQNKVPRNLPIYIFSGDKDPVGYFGKGIINLYNSYKNINIENVQYKLYKDGRHEMLNENNKDEVIKDIITWIDDVINKECHCRVVS